jgi:hypothetical protein
VPLRVMYTIQWCVYTIQLVYTFSETLHTFSIVVLRLYEVCGYKRGTRWSSWRISRDCPTRVQARGVRRHSVDTPTPEAPAHLPSQHISPKATYPYHKHYALLAFWLFFQWWIRNSSSSGGTVLKKMKPSFPPPDADEVPFLVNLTRIEFASVHDPAFFIMYASDAEIHAALGVHPLPAGACAPVPQGATPALSAAAFRAFVVSEFTAVCDNCRVPRVPPGIGNSDSAFQRLSDEEAEELSNRGVVTYLAWGATVAATAGAATGLLFIMRPSPRGADAQQTRRLTYLAPP